jgi:hypothetical protein
VQAARHDSEQRTGWNHDLALLRNPRRTTSRASSSAAPGPASPAGSTAAELPWPLALGLICRAPCDAQLRALWTRGWQACPRLPRPATRLRFTGMEVGTSRFLRGRFLKCDHAAGMAKRLILHSNTAVFTVGSCRESSRGRSNRKCIRLASIFDRGTRSADRQMSCFIAAASVHMFLAIQILVPARWMKQLVKTF